MNFDEAEVRFRELYARVQRGGTMSRADYEDQVSQLAIRDERGTWWEIHPYTARWMYFDGLQWVEGIPPGRTQVSVIAAAVSSARVSTRATPIAPAHRVLSSQPLAPETLRGTSPAKPEPPNRGRSLTLARDWSREWIPLAIGSVVLFGCAILLFFVGHFVLGGWGAQPAATPTALAVLPTPTPFPTLVPLPTRPPPSPTPVVVMAKVIERRVNVRAAPSTDAKIIGKLNRDEQIMLIGRNDDSTWYRIAIVGGVEPSWVFAETVEIVSGEPNALPLVSESPPQ